MEAIVKLRQINEKVKNPSTRNETYIELANIKEEDLSAGELMYYYYVKGKYHELLAKHDKQNSNMNFEKANCYYDEIYFIAENHGLSYRNPKYIFKRANTKFFLAKYERVEDAKALLLKAKSLIALANKEGLDFPLFKALDNKIEKTLTKLFPNRYNE